jgi:hypothetical protein
MVVTAAKGEDRPPREAKQGDTRRRSRRSSHKIRAKQEEYSALIGAGFEPTNDEDLWKKGGVWFGKEAALQRAWQELRESKGVPPSEQGSRTL